MTRRTMMAPCSWVGKLSTWALFRLSLALGSSQRTPLCTLLRMWCDLWRRKRSWKQRRDRVTVMERLTPWDAKEALLGVCHQQLWRFWKSRQSLTLQLNIFCFQLLCKLYYNKTFYRFCNYRVKDYANVSMKDGIRVQILTQNGDFCCCCCVCDR